MSGRHRERRPRRDNAGRALAGLSAVGATALVIGAASTAPAEASGADWIATAQCESSGDWSIHTGHYEGGLQFDPGTWLAYGGAQYAAHAYLATPAQQIAVAEKVLAKQGRGAWPVCFRAGNRAPAPAAKPAPAVQASTYTGPVTTYVVQLGDTLAGIASAHGTGWEQLAALNRATIPNPDVIYPGQTLRLPA
jgi:nucleoid-associated protein YgaU